MERNYFWRGGVRTDRGRYVMVKVPDHPYATADGYVRKHRLVMEKVVGRYLLPEEEVHHDDHNRANNDPSNLLLFANHKEHMRHHWREEWHLLYAHKRASHQSPAYPEACTNPAASESDARQ